jgi:hypothetical protein
MVEILFHQHLSLYYSSIYHIFKVINISVAKFRPFKEFYMVWNYDEIEQVIHSYSTSRSIFLVLK